MNINRCPETPVFNEHVQDNLVEKTATTKRIVDLFKVVEQSSSSPNSMHLSAKRQQNNFLAKENQMLKPNLIGTCLFTWFILFPKSRLL
jgi:hypothetical protein